MTSILTSVPAPPHLDAPRSAWDEPEGVAARGTVVVLTGRGESATAYHRLGRRLAADAYRVRVVELDLDDLDAARDDVRALLADPELPAPQVLLGSDTGATYAAVLAADPDVDLDGVVLAGLTLPDGGTGDAGNPAGPQDWNAELETRSACPAHRRVLSQDSAFERGALAHALPARWSGFTPRPSGRPTLVLHGAADPLTPVETALSPFRGAPRVQVRVVEGGRHDVLNDVSHRSVAATVVLFLEQLKLSADLPAIVRADS